MNTRITLSFICACLFINGCATTNNEVPGKTATEIRRFVNVIEPTIRPAAAIVCSMTIKLAVAPQDQAEVKAALLKVSAVIINSNGQDPTAFQSAIADALPQKCKALAPAIGGLYTLAFPYIKGDAQLTQKVLVDLAAGCADATR